MLWEILQIESNLNVDKSISILSNLIAKDVKLILSKSKIFKFGKV